jgi:Tfp pilus assembly protein PilF
MNDAIGRYQKMLEQDPGNELALFSLGKVLFDQGDYVGAKEYMARALGSRPDWMAAQILRARCEVYLENKPAARAELNRALELARQQGHVGPLAQVEELLRQLGPAVG